MERTVSWWDCGEFIATSWTLGVGHPPGAPTYQLVTHLAALLSFGHPMLVAPLCNAVSALCAGVTVGLLYGTIRLLGGGTAGALVGSLCYLFCDTAWFSAVESEVYAMAMLCCSLELYLALRCRLTGNLRLLLVVALVAGLGVGVHLMTLLVLPAVALVVLNMWRRRHQPAGRLLRLLLPAVFFFALGLSTYAIVPIRAAANPAINEYGAGFKSYIGRDQYDKAPLYPRMWRQRDADNWGEWNAGRSGFVGNAVYFVTYQLGYMYGRFWTNNFVARINDRWNATVFFVLPALLGLWGVWSHFRRRRWAAWTVTLLFLFGGPLLNIYLNHPCYEPRLRDYAYVLSFYAFAVWIGMGAHEASRLKAKWIGVVLLLAPVSMAVGNWSDHDRHRSHAAHDIALAHLESCDPNAILITLGDNDTFPLWYLQQVEHRRTDVSVYNMGLTGWHRLHDIVESNRLQRPIYLTHYCYRQHANVFGAYMRCEGFCWRVLLPSEKNNTAPLLHDAARLHFADGEYVDPIGRQFLDIWHENTGQ